MTEHEWTRLADLADEHIGPREEDVKFKVVAPILRLLGFTDLEVSFETPADLGRIDITVKGFPVGVVVECKGPHDRLEYCVAQVEQYVRETMTRQHAAMVSMLTNGKRFLVYGVLGPIHKNELTDHILLEFRRDQLKDADTQNQLIAFLGRNAVGGKAADICAAIESALRVRKDAYSKRELLVAQRATLMEQIREIDHELESFDPTSSRDIVSTVRPSTNKGIARIKWSKEYGPQETVCAWIGELLERLAPPGSTDFIPHIKVNTELCEFLSSRGTERAKSLSQTQRLEVAGNMIDWVTAQWTIALGGKDCDRMRTDPGAKVDAPDWLRQFTRIWTRKPMGKYAFRRR